MQASDDISWIDRTAQGLVGVLEARSRATQAPGSARRMARHVADLVAGIVQRIATLFRTHWDVGAFDVAFGSLKAFLVYPSVFRVGLAWLIPILEYLPLNTQLWTAGYLMGRRRLASTLCRRRLGHDLDAIDALRAQLLGEPLPEAPITHRFSTVGHEWVLQVRTGRLREWWRRVRGRPRERNVLRLQELRELVADPEFLHVSRALRGNPLLYTAVLVKKILRGVETRKDLLSRLEPEAGPRRREATPVDVIESEMATRARAATLSAALAQRARTRMGWVESLSLRWKARTQQRIIAKQLHGIREDERRVLASLLDGRFRESALHLRRIGERRTVIEACMSELEAMSRQVATPQRSRASLAVAASSLA